MSTRSSFFNDIYFDTVINNKNTFINDGFHCSESHKYITTHLIYTGFFFF